MVGFRRRTSAIEAIAEARITIVAAKLRGFRTRTKSPIKAVEASMYTDRFVLALVYTNTVKIDCNETDPLEITFTLPLVKEKYVGKYGMLKRAERPMVCAYRFRECENSRYGRYDAAITPMKTRIVYSAVNW